MNWAEQQRALAADVLGRVLPGIEQRLAPVPDETQAVNRETLDAQAGAALTRLNQIISGANTVKADASMTTAELGNYMRQVAAAVQDMARFQRAEIKLLRYLLGHPESLDSVDP